MLDTVLEDSNFQSKDQTSKEKMVTHLSDPENMLDQDRGQDKSVIKDPVISHL